MTVTESPCPDKPPTISRPMTRGRHRSGRRRAFAPLIRFRHRAGDHRALGEVEPPRTGHRRQMAEDVARTIGRGREADRVVSLPSLNRLPPWIPSAAGGCTPAWTSPPFDHVYARTARDCKYIIDIFWLPMACIHTFIVCIRRILRCDLAIEDDVSIMLFLPKSSAARQFAELASGEGDRALGERNRFNCRCTRRPSGGRFQKRISIGLRIFGDDPPDVRVRERDDTC